MSEGIQLMVFAAYVAVAVALANVAVHNTFKLVASRAKDPVRRKAAQVMVDEFSWRRTLVIAVLLVVMATGVVAELDLGGTA